LATGDPVVVVAMAAEKEGGLVRELPEHKTVMENVLRVLLEADEEVKQLKDLAAQMKVLNAVEALQEKLQLPKNIPEALTVVDPALAIASAAEKGSWLVHDLPEDQTFVENVLRALEVSKEEVEKLPEDQQAKVREAVGQLRLATGDPVVVVAMAAETGRPPGQAPDRAGHRERHPRAGGKQGGGGEAPGGPAGEGARGRWAAALGDRRPVVAVAMAAEKGSRFAFTFTQTKKVFEAVIRGLEEGEAETKKLPEDKQRNVQEALSDLKELLPHLPEYLPGVPK